VTPCSPFTASWQTSATSTGSWSAVRGFSVALGSSLPTLALTSAPGRPAVIGLRCRADGDPPVRLAAQTLGGRVAAGGPWRPLCQGIQDALSGERVGLLGRWKTLKTDGAIWTTYEESKASCERCARPRLERDPPASPRRHACRNSSPERPPPGPAPSRRRRPWACSCTLSRLHVDERLEAIAAIGEVAEN